MAVVALGAAVTLPALIGGAARAQSGDGSGAPAAEPELPGFGQAVGQLVRVDPRAAGLSFGLEVGAAKASHQQFTSRASSRVIDTGLLGLSLASESCDGGDPTWPLEDQPQAITIDSRTEGAAEGVALDEPLFDRTISAAATPLSTASVSSDPIEIPGLIRVDAARAEAHSGMTTPGLREAVATVDIGGIDLLGGLVRLRGLHWESIHRGGTEATSTGSFSLGSVEIGGVPLALPDPADLLAPVNELLSSFGIRIGLPEVHESGGVLFVDPIALIVEPNPARDAISGGLLRALQPTREALVDALFALSCDTTALVTLVDVIVGSLTGAGTFSIELGGTEATTEPIAAPAGLGAPPGIRGGGVTATTGAPAARPSPTGATRPTTRPGPSVGPAPTVPSGEQAVQPIAAPVPGEPGRDLAAVVGLVTIALGAVLVEGDRRSMRRSQRAAATAAAAAVAAEEAGP